MRISDWSSDVCSSDLATELSQALDAQVSLGSVKAQWDGIDPSFQLTDVDLTNRQGRKILHLPELRAELSWRSIFTGMLQFGLIEANGLDLTVRRDSDRRLWVMEQSLSQTSATNFWQEEDASGLRWVAMQRRVIFREATVGWLEWWRGAPSQVLER